MTRVTDALSRRLHYADVEFARPSNAPHRIRAAIGGGSAMSYSYWRTERLILDAVDRRLLRKTTVPNQIVSVLTSPDFLAVASICIIGLLVTFAVMFTVPDFWQASEALQQLL